MSHPTSLTSSLPIAHRGMTALAIAVASALVGWGCASRASLILTTQVLAHPHQSIDSVVALALCTIGALVALWFCVSSLLACVALGLRLAGRASTGISALIQRCGPAPIRRLVGVGVAGMVAVTLVATPASAQPHGLLPNDLGYVDSTSTIDPVESPQAPSDNPASLQSASPLPRGSAPLSPQAPSPSSSSSPLTSAPTPSPTPTNTPVPSPSPSLMSGPSAPPEAAIPTAATANGEPGSRAEHPIKRVDMPAPAPATGQPAPTVTPAPEPASASVIPAPAPSSDPASVIPALQTYVVAPGDSLWSITASLLGPEATDQSISTQWPLLYEANVDLIGPHPDLIYPGTVLSVPGPTTSEN